MHLLGKVKRIPSQRNGETWPCVPIIIIMAQLKGNTNLLVWVSPIPLTMIVNPDTADHLHIQTNVVDGDKSKQSQHLFIHKQIQFYTFIVERKKKIFYIFQ